MTTGAIEDISAELKTQYPPGTFEEPVNKNAPYRKSLQNVNLVVREGYTAVVPLGVASAWNVASPADAGPAQAPIDPTRVQGTVNPELFVGSFQIGVKTKNMATSGKSTFNPGGILPDRVESTVADLGKYIEEVYVGSNRGRLAIVATNPGANQFTCDVPMLDLLLHKNKRIMAFDALQSGNYRGSSAADGRKITVLDRSTHTVTYDGADMGAVAPGDSIFIQGTYGRTHWSLRDIVDDGTLCLTIYGQSRNTYPELKAFVQNGSAGYRDLNEALILDIIANIARETGQKVTRALANDGQGRKYVEFIQAERRYMGPTGSDVKYTIGYKDGSLKILAPGVDVDLEAAPDAEPGAIFFLTWSTFGRYEGMSMDWIDDDALLHLIPGTSVHSMGFLAYVGSIENQINTMPRANGKLGSLNDPILGT